MTSRKLYFNLLKENAKRRLWAIALLSLVFFFLFPVAAAYCISDYLNPEDLMRSGWEDLALAQAQMKKEVLNTFLSLTSLENGFIIFLLTVAAVLCAASGFSFLHSRKKTDFFHSIPVKREKIFFVVYLNGFLFTAIPFLVNLVLGSVLVQIKAAPSFPWGAVLTSYLEHMAFYLMIYSTAVLAVVMTGNTIVSLLGTAVFLLWGPAVYLLKLGYYATYFATYYGSMDDSAILERTSPLLWYASAGGQPGRAGVMAVWAFVIAMLLAALAIFLYKKRPSEAAGRAMAFKKSQAVIKTLLVVPFGLAGSLFFYMMKSYDTWSIFGLICGTAISYGVIEIIYHFDFKRLFSHKGQLIFSFVCAAALLAVFRFDLIGFDSFLPSEEKLETGGIYLYRMDSEAMDCWAEPELLDSGTGQHNVSWDYFGEEDLLKKMKISDKELILTVARQGVETAREIRSPGQGRRDIRDTRRLPHLEAYDSVSIAYHLKSGKTVFRRYYMNTSEVREQLDALYDEKEYKEVVYPILTAGHSDIAAVNYQECGELQHVKLSEEQRQRLLETYQEELMALTTKTRRNESPIAAIQFKTHEMQEMIELLRAEKRDYMSFNRYCYYPVYPSFTRTAGILKEAGIDAGNFLNPGNVVKIQLTDQYRKSKEIMETDASYTQAETETDRKDKSLTVTDKAQIEEILDSSYASGLNCENYLNPMEGEIQVLAFVKAETVKSEEGSRDYEEVNKTEDGEYEIYRLYLDQDRIPEFIKQAFSYDSEREKAGNPFVY